MAYEIQLPEGACLDLDQLLWRCIDQFGVPDFVKPDGPRKWSWTIDTRRQKIILYFVSQTDYDQCLNFPEVTWMLLSGS